MLLLIMLKIAPEKRNKIGNFDIRKTVNSSSLLDTMANLMQTLITAQQSHLNNVMKSLKFA